MNFKLFLAVAFQLTAGCLQGAYGQLAAYSPFNPLITINNYINRTLTVIDVPPDLTKSRKTLLIFYALPNGNSIEWTMGKQMRPGDDWHYDIQHIKAQTAFLRNLMPDRNIIVAYMANHLKSWPAWKKLQPDGPLEIRRMVDSIKGMFANYRPEVMLNSHSGGGSFLFGYIDGVTKIPPDITRIAFIDSDYGYEDSLHTGKLVQWLCSTRKHFLSVLAYNDSIVVYNGKPLVSATGGTWYRTRLMHQKLSRYLKFTEKVDTGFITYTALADRVDIRLKTNPYGKIYHTEQVARNGFIHTVISGTRYERKTGNSYWSERIYNAFIQ